MKLPHDALTTERLTLRRFTADDFDLLHRLHSDPQVMRYVGGTLPRAKSEEMLQGRILEYYERHPGLGIWATLERATGDCIGLHLLNHIQGETYIQVGYLLYPEYWGRGYATEMCREIVRYGFAELGLPRIVGITDMANVESQRVLLKAGLRRDGERSFLHPAYADSGPMPWFERDCADWLAERGLQPTSPST